MNKLFAAIGPALLACVLAIGSFLICARMFHVPQVATKVAVIVIIATTSLALLLTGAAKLKSRSSNTK
jgi:hypothetical protein